MGRKIKKFLFSIAGLVTVALVTLIMSKKIKENVVKIPVVGETLDNLLTTAEEAVNA